MSSIKKVGIIGRGNFGGLLISLVPKDVSVLVYTRKNDPISDPGLADVLSADVVFLAVPISAYADLLPQIAPLIPAETLLVDVCSVKVEPAELIRKLLPKHSNVMLTHPLFGPQSAGQSLPGRSLILTHGKGQRVDEILAYARDVLKLKIVRVSNEEHDQHMAWVHALTFFIAQALLELGVRDEPFMTPSYQHLVNLMQLGTQDTKELWLTIQRGNPYADSVRVEFLNKLDGLEREIITKPDEESTGNLTALRQELDLIDRQVIKLLAKRFETTQKVGIYKRDNGLGPVDPAREAEMFERITKLSEEEGLDPEFARSFLRLTIDAVVKKHRALQSLPE